MSVSVTPDVDIEFDFEGHADKAARSYSSIFRDYEDYASTIRSILKRALASSEILVHSIEARAKKVDSFRRKAAQISAADARRPKYDAPLVQVTDLAAARVITFFLKTVDEVDIVIDREFEVIEKTNRSELLAKEERLGYQSIHYLVKLNAARRSLPEYSRFAGMVVEIQVRTILQHAWAEIEHDIQYKSIEVLPAAIKRRFLALAGLLEIGDREFQAISDDHGRLREQARVSVSEGRLEEVEITPDALKEYLDKKIGPDLRVAAFSYLVAVKYLKDLGFSSLDEVDRAISRYDHDQLSRIIHGTRQGQLTRFEDMVMAAMGDRYLERHPLSSNIDGWFSSFTSKKLAALREAGIPVGPFDVKSEV